MVSPTASVKAITSCLTRASISLMRAASTRARSRRRAAASRGTTPRLGQRVGGRQLDFEPALEAALVAPDAAHFRARVSGNHANKDCGVSVGNLQIGSLAGWLALVVA